MIEKNGLVTMEIFLGDLLNERETLLVRLGQIEDILIEHDMLNARTKQPRHKRRTPNKAWLR
jgi:hypothetical protein